MLETKIKNLNKSLSEMQSVAVAYSGGIDSTLLLKVAYDCLGRNVPVLVLWPAGIFEFFSMEGVVI